MFMLMLTNTTLSQVDSIILKFLHLSDVQNLYITILFFIFEDHKESDYPAKVRHGLNLIEISSVQEKLFPGLHSDILNTEQPNS